MIIPIIATILATGAGQIPQKLDAPYPDPAMSGDRLNERLLRAIEFAAIVESSGDVPAWRARRNDRKRSAEGRSSNSSCDTGSAKYLA